jgi:hypothetical protein
MFIEIGQLTIPNVLAGSSDYLQEFDYLSHE